MEPYGFSTRQRISFLKADAEKKKDIKDIVKLHNPQNVTQRTIENATWELILEKEKGDLDNFTMIVRDKCQKPIGLAFFKTEDKRDFDIDIWIPDPKKKNSYLQFVVESIVEWIEDYTDISKIRYMRELESKPRMQQYGDVLMENYCVAAV